MTNNPYLPDSPSNPTRQEPVSQTTENSKSALYLIAGGAVLLSWLLFVAVCVAVVVFYSGFGPANSREFRFMTKKIETDSRLVSAIGEPIRISSPTFSYRDETGDYYEVLITGPKGAAKAQLAMVNGESGKRVTYELIDVVTRRVNSSLD